MPRRHDESSMGATHSFMKTLPRVTSEVALHVLAHNLPGYINCIQPLNAAIRA